MDAVSHMATMDFLEGDRWSGRTGAVSDLFLAHHRRLVGLASLLVDDKQTAEDVVQDAFSGLYRRGRSSTAAAMLYAMGVG